MGCYHNTYERNRSSRPRRAPSARRSLTLSPLAVGAALLLSVAQAAIPYAVFAAEPVAAADRPDRPVSTSPEPREQRNAVPGSLARDTAADPLPLTRAAAQQRVEGMSPVDWLARFGPVSIDSID